MRNKKLLSIFMALAFLFSAVGLAFAPVPALANNPGQYLDGDAIPPDPENPNGSTVLLDNTTIGVTFIIEAGDALDEDAYVIEDTRFREELAVNVSAEFGKAITITTLLNALNDDPTNGLTFLKKSGTTLLPIDDDTNYLSAVTYLNAGGVATTWAGGNQWLGYDGWMVRVNDEYLVKATNNGQGYEGLGILQTALSEGDIVHFFYDFPSKVNNEDFAANYVRGVFDGYDGSDPVIQIQGHKTNIHGSDAIMGVYNYVDLGEGVSASIYASDGTTQIGTAEFSDENGEVTFTGLAPGTYILKTTPTYHEDEDYGMDDAFFTLTGAYSEITIPPAPDTGE